MAAVMLCLRKHLQKPDRGFECSPSFFLSACVLAAPLPNAVRALLFLLSLSSISCHLPYPPSCRHLAEHQRRPPTFPVLSFFPFSLSAHRHHPSSPALPLFSASSPHPIALSPPRHRRLSPPSLHHLHRRLLPPSWSIPLPPPLSLSLSSLLLFLRLPDVLLWVISASARISMASKLVALNPSTSAPPFLPSSRHRPRPLPLSSMPSPWPPAPRPPLLLPRPHTAATFLPPPLMSSPPPYFSIAALPPHQGPKRVLVRQRHRPFSSPPLSATTAVDSSRRWASAKGRRWCLPHPLQLLGW